MPKHGHPTAFFCSDKGNSLLAVGWTDEVLTRVDAGWIHPLPAGRFPGESLQPMARDSMTGSAGPLQTRERGKSDGEGGAQQLQPFCFNNPRCFPESIFTSFSAEN